MGYEIKRFGKWSHQLEYPLALYNFKEFWMPYSKPSEWEIDWDIFLECLLETDWISNSQFKRWKKPDFSTL
jgi:hypothetical protein